MVEFRPATTTDSAGISNSVYGRSGVNSIARDPVVEGVKHRHEMLPLWPVRPNRIGVIPLLRLEIPLAEHAVHVVVAGHDDHPVARQRDGVCQSSEEFESLVELLRPPRLRQVAGDHDQVRASLLFLHQFGEIGIHRCGHGTTRIRHVQHRQAVPSVHGRPPWQHATQCLHERRPRHVPVGDVGMLEAAQSEDRLAR